MHPRSRPSSLGSCPGPLCPPLPLSPASLCALPLPAPRARPAAVPGLGQAHTASPALCRRFSRRLCGPDSMASIPPGRLSARWRGAAGRGAQRPQPGSAASAHRLGLSSPSWPGKNSLGGSDERGSASPKDPLCVCWEADSPSFFPPHPGSCRGGGEAAWHRQNKTCSPFQNRIFSPSQKCRVLLNARKTFAATFLLCLLTCRGFGALFSLLL